MPEDPPEFRAHRADARLASFYRTSTVEDAWLMDFLVRTRFALSLMMNLPGVRLTPAIREELNRAGGEVDRLFASFREHTRTCPTFAGLGSAEQVEIERSVFEVGAPPNVSPSPNP